LTTAAVALVRGDTHAAWAANPAIFLLAALVAATCLLVPLRATGLLRPPRPWPSTRRRTTGWVIGLLALASWLFQLHRLDLA
jgi:hypothetical protein